MHSAGWSIQQGASVRQHKLSSRDWKIIKGLLYVYKAGAGACIVLEQHRAHFRNIHWASFLFSIQPQLITTQISGSIMLIHSKDIRLYSFNVKQYHFTTKHLKVMKLFINKMTKRKKETVNLKYQKDLSVVAFYVLTQNLA